jgi:hypothetical protein
MARSRRMRVRRCCSRVLALNGAIGIETWPGTADMWKKSGF